MRSKWSKPRSVFGWGALWEGWAGTSIPPALTRRAEFPFGLPKFAHMSSPNCMFLYGPCEHTSAPCWGSVTDGPTLTQPTPATNDGVLSASLFGFWDNGLMQSGRTRLSTPRCGGRVGRPHRQCLVLLLPGTRSSVKLLLSLFSLLAYTPCRGSGLPRVHPAHAGSTGADTVCGHSEVPESLSAGLVGCPRIRRPVPSGGPMEGPPPT